MSSHTPRRPLPFVLSSHTRSKALSNSRAYGTAEAVPFVRRLFRRFSLSGYKAHLSCFRMYGLRGDP
jgi:hypothetical protein